MVGAVLDPQGRLIEFLAVPDPDAAPSAAGPDWSVLLAAADLDAAGLESTEPKDVPQMAFDNRVAWKGSWRGNAEIPIVVEAASWRGKPVSFKVQGPWSSGVPEAGRTLQQHDGALTAITITVVIFSLFAGSFLAWHNVRVGRGDRRGAFRLALFALSLLLLSWVFGSDHGLDANEFNLFLNALSKCLYWTCIVAVAYLAIEPFVRQRWPHALISWNRVLEGRFKDPLVGRDILIGVVFAAGLSLARTATLLTHIMSPVLPEADLLGAMVRDSYAVSFLLNLIFDSADIPLALFLLFAIFRIVTRSQWFAALGLIVLINAFVNIQNPEASGILIGTLFGVLWLVAVTRFGLICSMSLWFADRVFRAITMLKPDAWYAGRFYLLLGAVLLLAVYSFKISLGNQPIVSPKILGPQS
jgi:serine/threonine-protein kinase